MGLFRRAAAAAPVEERMTWQDYVGTVSTVAATSSAPSLEKALRNAASWACIDVLADSIARTPFDAFRKVDGRRVEVTPTPQIVADPSGVVEDDVWRTQLAISLLSDGNAFGMIVDTVQRGQYLLPTQIEWMAPAAVTNRRLDETGWPTIDMRDHAGRTTTEYLWPKGRVFHIPGRMVAPGSPFGLSPIEYANRTIGTSLSVEDYTTGFFGSGGHPTAIVTSDQELDQAQTQQIKDRVRQVLRAGGREPLVMGSGLKYENIQTTPTDTGFLELLRFNVEQSCRFWRVPPGMVYLALAGSSITYQNVTDADLLLLKYSLDGYLVRIEKRWSRCLPSPQYVKANRDAVLQADVGKRMATHAIRLTNRIASVNEVRALEDEAPFDDPMFDEPGIPPWTPTAPMPAPTP